MDDLEFRRTIYADPNCKDPEVLKAAKEDTSKRIFWDELKQLDNELQQATKVEVPEGLAERLILKQSIASHTQQKKRTRIHLALAASFAFVFGVVFTMLQQPDNRMDLGEHALAHVYHDGFYAMARNDDVSLQQVNAKLAELGANLSADVGKIMFAKFCNFDGIRSLHMVMQGEQGKITVFVVPNNNEFRSSDSFSDGKLYGESYEFGQASLVIVADQDQSFDDVKTKLKEKLVFSA